MSTETEPQTIETADHVALADQLKAGHDRIVAEMRKLIVGQEEVIEQILLTLFAGGNSLIVGVPGLAKTLLIRPWPGCWTSNSRASSSRPT